VAVVCNMLDMSEHQRGGVVFVEATPRPEGAAVVARS
jgi:hypothetical protein